MRRRVLGETQELMQFAWNLLTTGETRSPRVVANFSAANGAHFSLRICGFIHSANVNRSRTILVVPSTSFCINANCILSEFKFKQIVERETFVVAAMVAGSAPAFFAASFVASNVCVGSRANSLHMHSVRHSRKNIEKPSDAQKANMGFCAHTSMH